MWPKALLQLMELAPHITRLVPVADRYLQSKGDSGKAQKRALDEMGERLRGDMGRLSEGLRGDVTRVATTQAEIDRQMKLQSEALASIAAEMQAMRRASDELEARSMRMEKGLQRLWITVLAGLVVFTMLGVWVIVFLHSRP